MEHTVGYQTKNELSNQIQILDEIVSASLYANALWKQ